MSSPQVSSQHGVFHPERYSIADIRIFLSLAHLFGAGNTAVFEINHYLCTCRMCLQVAILTEKIDSDIILMKETIEINCPFCS